MCKGFSLGRWTVRTIRLLLLASAIVIASAASAQGPQAPQLPKITYTKNTVFHLPVQMEERTRANLREVCLYVKTNGGDWIRQETGLPTMSHFTYRVPNDGEYWFSLVTVDKAGKMTPADPNLEPPGLRVVVDTQAPIVEVQPWTSPEGDFYLRCQVQDANIDPQWIKASYRDQTGEHLVEAAPGHPGLFKIVGREVLNQPLRITATDLCGNVGMRDINVREMVIAALQANNKIVPVSGTSEPQSPSLPPVPNLAPASAPAPAPQPATASPPPSPPSLPGVNPAQEIIRTEVQKPALPPIPPLPSGTEKTLTSSVTPPPAAPPIAPPPLPTPSPEKRLTMHTPPPEPTPTTAPTLPSIPQVPSLTKEAPLSRPAIPSSGQKQYLNTNHATIDYRIDQVGPSGVGKVEIYLTGDAGQNWQRIGEDHDRRSPAEVDLPGEGVYGIRLAVTNGNGFGGTPPARGDAPTVVIEVDTTAPIVQLRPIEAAQNGVLELRWTASDKNLSAEPVNLYYRTRQDGPWQSLARAVKNDGLYRWSFPRDQGSQFFVKVEVADLAGNVAHAETPNAIVLDVTEPHASVLGVSGGAPRSVSPSGN